MKCALILLIAMALALPACAQKINAPGHVTQIPLECDKPSLRAYGHPVMLAGRNALVFGISLAKHEFKSGEPIKLYIWVYNSSNAPAGVSTCTNLELFKRIGFRIFSQGGRWILSRDELQAREWCSTNPKYSWGYFACARNILFSIPAHACLTRDDYDFTTELTGSYALPPGNYIIRLRTHWGTPIGLCKPERKSQFRPRRDDLKFTVVAATDSPPTRGPADLLTR